MLCRPKQALAQDAQGGPGPIRDGAFLHFVKSQHDDSVVRPHVVSVGVDAGGQWRCIRQPVGLGVELVFAGSEDQLTGGIQEQPGMSAASSGKAPNAGQERMGAPQLLRHGGDQTQRRGIQDAGVHFGAQRHLAGNVHPLHGP